MERKSGDLIEWVLPVAFISAASYVVWNLPRYLISLGYAAEALKLRFPTATTVDYLILAALPFLFIAGAATVRRAKMEYEDVGGFDRISIFLGRVTMMLIAILVGVMFYEVVVRYIFEKPTLWANELSLWMAGFVFMLSGLYAMQQRSHIRIFILYDMFPRWLQKVADVISTVLIVIFAAALVYGGWNEAKAKFFRWETFGTAFDPPIPATLKPAIMILICLVAIQAISNLIRDWSKEKEKHLPVDDLDDLPLGAIGDNVYKEKD